VSPTLFIGFLVVHILLVESLDKRENVFFFFVDINCCVLGPLTIYFSIGVKEFSKKRSCFLLFSSFFFCCFFFFFEKKILFLWPYYTGKIIFRLWLAFFLVSNKPVFGCLISLRGLRQPPNLPYSWAGPDHVRLWRIIWKPNFR
jgi:hypothetical protein